MSKSTAKEWEALKQAVDELADKVVNLAIKLDKHMNEADAHHVALLAKKGKK